MAVLALIIGILLALYKRGRKKWHVLERRREIRQLPNSQPIHVFMHVKGQAMTTAALINMLYRQASQPTRVHCHILESLDTMKNPNELADVRQMYVTHHNTVIDHRSRLHVQTSLDSKPPTPAAALQHLLTTSPNINGLGVWMSARTVFVCRGWDRLLEQALARAAPSTLVTAVPLPASHAPIRALALLGKTGGYQKEDDLELSLPQRVRYPVVDRHGRLGSAVALRPVPPTSVPLRSPLLHPSLVVGPLPLLLTRHRRRPPENADLEMSHMWDGGTRFALLPFNMACEDFIPVRSHSRQQSSNPELQLGMWVGGSPAERLLGIIFRHGTERDFLHRLQRQRALFKAPKDTGVHAGGKRLPRKQKRRGSRLPSDRY